MAYTARLRLAYSRAATDTRNASLAQVPLHRLVRCGAVELSRGAKGQIDLADVVQPWRLHTRASHRLSASCRSLQASMCRTGDSRLRRAQTGPGPVGGTVDTRVAPRWYPSRGGRSSAFRATPSTTEFQAEASPQAASEPSASARSTRQRSCRIRQSWDPSPPGIGTHAQCQSSTCVLVHLPELSCSRPQSMGDRSGRQRRNVAG